MSQAALSCTTQGTDPLCNGGSDGSATVSVQGGTSGYTYVWSNGDNAQTADTLSAGIYTVTVTDANQCTKTCTVQITEPTLLTGNYTLTDVTCNGGNDGTASFAVAGGTPPYDYVWSDGQSTSTATGLVAAIYTVTVTDANGCTVGGADQVSEPSAIQTTLTPTNSTCGFANGSVSSSVSGGTPGYTYEWSNGSTMANISGLSASSYSLIVSDGNGCKDTATTSVNDIGGPSVTADSTDVLCNGGNTGTATATASGGTPGYTYIWSNNQTTATATGLIAGTYTVTVFDQNQCQASTTIVVNEPAALSCTTQGTDPLCNGGSDGSATVSSSGGTAPYTYAWSNGDNAQTADTLSAGIYTVTVTDANQCTKTCTVQITEPTLLTGNYTLTDVTCNGGNDGTASFAVAGGTPPYDYVWSDGQSTSTATGLVAAIYTVTVTDANGCTVGGADQVSEPSAIQTTLTPTNSTCGFANGSVSSSVSGGTPGYTYEWSNGSTMANISGLSASSYSLIVTDANGCKDTANTSVNDLGGPSVTADSTDVLCNGGNTGTATATASGGTPGYTYIWSNNQTTATATGLIAGTYTVTVFDQNQCQASTTIVVNEPAALSCTTQGTNPLCNGGSDGSATVSVQGGTSGYTYAWSNGDATATADTLIAGTYTVTVTDANQCITTCTVTIGEPTALNCQIQGNGPLCNGGSDGSATIIGLGGTQPYTYVWSNGQTSSTANGLIAGTYTATVTDANQCTSSCIITLGGPPVIQLTLTPSNSTCGFANGSVSSNVSGGTGAYTYAWSTGATTQNLNGVTSSIYSLIVTDENNCKDTAIAFVGNLSGPSASISGTDPLCNGDNTGTATANVNGGATPYSYFWSNGQSTPTASGLAAGTHTVTVYDANQCETSAIVTLVDPPAVTCSATGTNPLCFGGNDGTATALALGGSAGGGQPVFGAQTYYYMWNDGQTTSTATGLGAGTYTVTVSDDNQCTSTCTVTLIEPTEIILSKTDTFCFIEYGISNYQHGAELTSVSAGDVTVSISANANLGKPDKVIVFNSGMTGTLDPDLEVDLGNLMILPDNITDANNDLLVDVPNDNQYGGTITLDFSDNVKVVSFKYVDQDDPSPSYARAYDVNNVLISSVTISNGGNGSVQVIAMNADNIRRLEFELAGSGGIADLELACPSTAGQGATGSIDLTVAGGTPGYSYQWSNGATTQDIAQVPAGFYTVTVTDANNCSKTCSTLLSSPNLPISNCSVTREIACNGDNNGEVTVQVIGGQAPYTVLWSTGATSNTIVNCTAGSYSLTVTDANGFVAYESMVLGEPVVINNNITTNDPTSICLGEKVLLEAVYDASYTYQWYKFNTPFANGTNHQFLAYSKGQYRVVITNNNGCTSVSNAINITKYPSPEARLTAQGSTTICPGTSVDLSVVYEPGNTYKWIRWGKVLSTSGNTYSASKVGAHRVKVTSVNGCAAVSNKITVAKHPKPKVVLDELGPVSFCNGTTMDLTALPMNSPGPYTFKWYRYGNLITGATSPVYTVTQTGGYEARVIDANGCTDKSSRTIVSRINCAPRFYEPKLNVSVYPNPFKDEINIEILGDEEKPLRVAIYNVLGEVVYEKDVANIYSLNRINLSGLVNGVYLMEVRQGEEVKHIKINKLN